MLVQLDSFRMSRSREDSFKRCSSAFAPFHASYQQLRHPALSHPALPPAAAPQDYPGFPNKQPATPVYHLTPAFPLVKRFPSTDHTHLATCLSLTQEHALSSLFITFLLNAPICSLIFSFLFLKCTIGVGKLGPGHGRGSGTSCRLQRRDSLRA